MSSGELLFLALSIATFGGFGLWLGYVSWRFDRFRAGRPEALRHEPVHHTMHATAD